MSVALVNNCIVIDGDCGVEDAETLLALCQANDRCAVDISRARVLHTALWQVLMVVSSPIIGEPDDPFIRHWVMPILVRPNALGTVT